MVHFVGKFQSVTNQPKEANPTDVVTVISKRGHTVHTAFHTESNSTEFRIFPLN
jgi:hypothetical protein